MKYATRILLFSGLALGVLGCAGQFTVETTVDEDGYTVTHLPDNEIGIEG